MTLAPLHSRYTMGQYSACLQHIASPSVSAHAPLLLLGTLIHRQCLPKVQALVC